MADRGAHGGSRSARGEAMNRNRHTPVLLTPALEHLQPRDGGTYIDATFGAGGYTRAILDAADCRVLAIDRDPSAVAGGAGRASAYAGRLTLRQGRFSELEEIARQCGLTQVDGVVFDLGVSSMQLDEPERGFSFQADGPLDMRMSMGPTAADLLKRRTAGGRQSSLRRSAEAERRAASSVSLKAARTCNSACLSGLAWRQSHHPTTHVPAYDAVNDSWARWRRASLCGAAGAGWPPGGGHIPLARGPDC